MARSFKSNNAIYIDGLTLDGGIKTDVYFFSLFFVHIKTNYEYSKIRW